MNAASGIDRQGLGENVRRLRQARRMTQSNLAGQATVSLPALRNIESGKVIPKVDTLQAIAAALDSSVLELLKPVHILKYVRFRAKRRLRTRNEILSEVAGWLENFQELEGLLEKKSPDPQLQSIWSGLKRIAEPKQRAEKAAVLLRQAWGIGEDDTIRNICGLFTRHGIKILSLPIQNREFFGLSVGPQDGGPAVIVNTWDRITVERWIFSAAHELGHLILHQDAFNVEETEENDEQEREADIFAAHFLMPDEAFAKELNSLRGLYWVDIVLALKRIFKVSWKTVVIRLQQKGLLDASAWARFYAQIRERYGYSLAGYREPYPLSAADYVDDRSEFEGLRRIDFPAAQLRLGALVSEALEQGKITMSRASKILGCSIRDVRDLAKDWKIRQHDLVPQE
jgi:Zn-dependent peptidase ImmA (M78 family)/transcriptional regulator with XRE-family HTH domain